MSAKARPRLFWLIGIILHCCAPGVAWGQSDACALSRAVVAGEIALRDALSQMDGDTTALRAALARLASTQSRSPSPDDEIKAYLVSRAAIAGALAAEGALAARRLARAPEHLAAGQAALAATGADRGCGAQASSTPDDNAQSGGSGATIGGGHGGVAEAGEGAASGAGRTSQPGGGGLATSPLSFLKDFDMQLHVLPAFGATLAFGALIFALTRDRRQHRRYLCHMPLVVEIKGGAAFESTLLDVSQGGGKLVKKGDWGVGAALSLRLAAGDAPRTARVMWANKGFIGVSFRKALTAQEFQQLLQRAKTSGGVAARARR